MARLFQCDAEFVLWRGLMATSTDTAPPRSEAGPCQRTPCPPPPLPLQPPLPPRAPAPPPASNACRSPVITS
ncbi:hypothetical protein CRM95_27640 [Burkholderia gladioli]|nr:hypothetical protein [Burkholderia sp. Ap-962]NIF89902.1 hypothetical protein [Burkholderia sp. Cy-637]PEH81895.1 hypothetical protein CRM95_27640 [Burkholderia gladioli]